MEGREGWSGERGKERMKELSEGGKREGGKREGPCSGNCVCIYMR